MDVFKGIANSELEPSDGAGDTSSKQSYVRVTKIDNRGYVEFQFSIGDPNLYLEMALPRMAFDEFCETQQAQHLTQEQGRLVDQTELKWRYGDFAADDQILDNGS